MYKMQAGMGDIVITPIYETLLARGVRFESYCERRVRGALLDELRTQDWLPRPWRQRTGWGW